MIIYFFHHSIDATFSDAFGKMVNDATGNRANCVTKIVYVNKEPCVCLFANRDIAEGEELRYDYGVPNLPWRKQVLTFIIECKYHMYLYTKVVLLQLINPLSCDYRNGYTHLDLARLFVCMFVCILALYSTQFLSNRVQFLHVIRPLG